MPAQPTLTTDTASAREKRRVAYRRTVRLALTSAVVIGMPVFFYLLLPALPSNLTHVLLGGSVGFASGFVGGMLILLWLAAVLSLGVDVVGLLADRRRRRSLACPNCGLRESPPTIDFGHKAIAGTGWEALACPQCHKEWHLKL